MSTVASLGKVPAVGKIAMSRLVPLPAVVCYGNL
jgi:hypothetical protein